MRRGAGPNMVSMATTGPTPVVRPGVGLAAPAQYAAP